MLQSNLVPFHATCFLLVFLFILMLMLVWSCCEHNFNKIHEKGNGRKTAVQRLKMSFSCASGFPLPSLLRSAVSAAAASLTVG